MLLQIIFYILYVDDNYIDGGDSGFDFYDNGKRFEKSLSIISVNTLECRLIPMQLKI